MQRVLVQRIAGDIPTRQLENTMDSPPRKKQPEGWLTGGPALQFDKYPGHPQNHHPHDADQ